VNNWYEILILAALIGYGLWRYSHLRKKRVHR